MFKNIRPIASTIIFILLSVTAFAQSNRTDSIVYSKIDVLPEMHAYIKNAENLFNRSKSQGHPRVSTMIRQRPSKKFKYYWVQVGVMSDDIFTPEMNFYVLPQTYEVRYLETSTDSVLTIAQWRKRKLAK